jgi:hypothetical protein
MAAALPDDATGVALLNMFAGGDDLTKPRLIDFSVIFRSRDAALKFIGHFAALNCHCHLRGEHYGDEYFDVTISKVMSPTHEGITAFELELETVAKPLGGENDGWGCFGQDGEQLRGDGSNNRWRRRARLAWQVLLGRPPQPRAPRRVELC